MGGLATQLDSRPAYPSPQHARPADANSARGASWRPLLDDFRRDHFVESALRLCHRLSVPAETLAHQGILVGTSARGRLDTGHQPGSPKLACLQTQVPTLQFPIDPAVEVVTLK